MKREKRMRRTIFSLPQEMIREVQPAVEAGSCGSPDDLVRAVVQRELDRLREAQFQREFEQAKDPLFLRDIEETMSAFASADAETARMIPNDV